MRRTTIDWLALGPVSTPEDLAAGIEIGLARGDLLPGDYLPPERDLADILSVSRSTVREAIHELELRRRVQRQRGRGSVLIASSDIGVDVLGSFLPRLRRLGEAQDLRSALEPTIAARCAIRATPAELKVLRAVLDTSGHELTAEASVEIDLRFHRMLADCTHNPLFPALLDSMVDLTRDERESSHRTIEGRRHSHEGHLEILRAVEARDTEGAAAAMSEHLATITAVIEQHLRTDDD